MIKGLVSVVLVNWNTLRFLDKCLACLQKQTYKKMELIIVDNGSTDGSVEFLRSLVAAEVVYLPRNEGFARANNVGINRSSGEFVLTLNVDAFPREDFVEKLVAALRENGKAGSAGGRLYTTSLAGEETNILDTTGLFIGPDGQPCDRGHNTQDNGRYQTPEMVFGICAAAALYRREMLEDICLDGQFFDEQFFAYYEDADLAWRAWHLGWSAVYVPGAVGFHVRGGSNGKKISAAVRTHYFKNRYLMLIKNWTPGGPVRFLPVLLYEVKRLARGEYRFSALMAVLRSVKRARAQRHQIVKGASK